MLTIFKNSAKHYIIAIIHLIVQIIGIVFWAIGRFIGLTTGSDAKTQSEGEA